MRYFRIWIKTEQDFNGYFDVASWSAVLAQKRAEWSLRNKSNVLDKVTYIRIEEVRKVNNESD